MTFRTEKAALAFYGRPFARQQMTIGARDDSFVAFTLLSEAEVPRVRQLLPPDSAARLSEISGLTILHVARESRRVRGTSFSISVRELWGPADL
jgi:hypothetical protein